MLGANLRQLAQRAASISALCRDLGINRTQFNRYLAGESFPRPDVLSRICTFFEVDARILLEPVEEINVDPDPVSNPYLRDFVGIGAQGIPEDHFPSGFYRFSRRSYLETDVFVVGIVHIHRQGPLTFLRGYEPKAAMLFQHLPANPETREFRGVVMKQEDGISIVASRYNAMTSSFNYLARVASFDNNFWLGYATRTMPEERDSIRVTRLVYEHVGREVKDALPLARRSGFFSAETLPPYHRRLLRTDQPFS